MTFKIVWDADARWASNGVGRGDNPVLHVCCTVKTWEWKTGMLFDNNCLCLHNCTSLPQNTFSTICKNQINIVASTYTLGLDRPKQVSGNKAWITRSEYMVLMSISFAFIFFWMFEYFPFFSRIWLNSCHS